MNRRLVGFITVLLLAGAAVMGSVSGVEVDAEADSDTDTSIRSAVAAENAAVANAEFESAVTELEAELESDEVEDEADTEEMDEIEQMEFEAEDMDAAEAEAVDEEAESDSEDESVDTTEEVEEAEETEESTEGEGGSEESDTDTSSEENQISDVSSDEDESEADTDVTDDSEESALIETENGKPKNKPKPAVKPDGWRRLVRQNVKCACKLLERHNSDELRACKRQCKSLKGCNVVNYNHFTRICDMRECGSDSTSGKLKLNKKPKNAVRCHFIPSVSVGSGAALSPSALTASNEDGSIAEKTDKETCKK